MNKYFRLLTDKVFRFNILNSRGFYRNVPDAELLKRKYKLIFGKELDLENPKTFNEKLQWLKLYDRKPEYTTMVDKVAAKRYVAEKIGEEYVIPTLGVWDRFDDIDFDSLPNQFVLKCTHDSGGLVIVRDKAKLDRAAAKKKIEKCLRRNYYYLSREWPYKDVKPRILAEAYMEDDQKNRTLKDYKLFCFSGEPKSILTVTGGHDDESKILRRMYDPQWNLLPIALHGKPMVTEAEPMPEQLPELLRLAGILSKDMPHLRTDFYVVNGKIYFGELTFYHMSGLARMDPPEWGQTFGSFIVLPGITNKGEM